MEHLSQRELPRSRGRLWPCLPLLICLICALPVLPTACGSHGRLKIAVIPRTDGFTLWEAAHVGAEEAAGRTNTLIYWNAPTREDDVEAQIAMVNRIVDQGYRGLVIAPDQALSLISPVRRALARGVPTVVIASPLSIAPGGELSYILNDDPAGGRMAAERTVELLGGHGSVAILGVNPAVASTLVRTRAFEESLARSGPGIHVVDVRTGSFNRQHEQQVAEETLRAHSDLDVIVALTGAAVDGALSALEAMPEARSTRVIGFDSDNWPPFRRSPSLDLVVQQDTREMGRRAVELLQARVAGRPVPALVTLPPRMITPSNVHSAEVRHMLSSDWTLGRWQWSALR